MSSANVDVQNVVIFNSKVISEFLDFYYALNDYNLIKKKNLNNFLIIKRQKKKGGKKWNSDFRVCIRAANRKLYFSPGVSS